jgi:hypothetical protein
MALEEGNLLPPRLGGDRRRWRRLFACGKSPRQLHELVAIPFVHGALLLDLTSRHLSRRSELSQACR